MGLADAVSERLNAAPAEFLARHAADNSLATILPAISSALINESGGQCAAVWEWLKEQPQRSETVRFTLLSSRTNGIVKQTDWLDALNETNKKLRRTAAAAQKEIIL